MAPFHVIGTIDLFIKFADKTTHIKAHIAKNLCTNIILGMDYINSFNLSINVKRQTISIEHQKRVLTMKIDSDDKLPRIPVTSVQPMTIPPYSTRFTRVSIPLSTICSSLNPDRILLQHNCTPSTDIVLDFRNYCATIPITNSSHKTFTMRKGFRVGFLFSHFFASSAPLTPPAVAVSVESTGSPGDVSAFSDSKTDNLNNIASSSSPLMSSSRRSDRPRDIPHNRSCNNIQKCDATITNHLDALVKPINDQHHRNLLRALIARFGRNFDTTSHNIANTPIHHVINTVPHSPPACRPYPQPDKEEPMYKLMQEFLQAGLISESHSPYAAPAILVKKKDGSFRFVVDYKKLNLVTIKDSSPLPNMEDTIRKLGQGYNYFSKLDLKSGFYQIPINAADKAKTAFVTPFGLYQFNVLPMGLKNSPPTFQKVMNDTLSSCRNFALVYLDDIIVFSKSFDEHLYHLERVLSSLQAKNLILNPPKCVLAADQIDYLGHTISRTHIRPMKEKIEAILQIKEPRSLAQANKFIGALSWYRKFFPRFATVAAPIHAVTNFTKDNRHKFKWNFAQSQAFHQLKRMLISEPLFLHYPVEDKPVVLTTDASAIGVGGVLQQEVDGELRNLYYHSQLMTPCERKYSTIEKEALAIYKCFARMRTFLLGRTITLMTDHCPLCHIMEKTVHNARVDRITHLIQEFNVDQVIHIKGRENCLPDYLSRYSKDTDDDLFDIDYGLESRPNPRSSTSLATRSSSTSALTPKRNREQLLAAMVLRPRLAKPQFSPPHTSMDTHSISSDNQSDVPLDSTPEPSTSHRDQISPTFSRNHFDNKQIKDEQFKDPVIRNILDQLDSSSNHTSFVMKKEILHKLITPSRHSIRKISVIYVPSSMVNTLLQACHDDPMTGAHFSLDRTYTKIRLHYWWPNMKSEIKQYINSCALCKQFNVDRQKRGGHLRPISPPEGPFHMIGIDYCGPLERTPSENQYVLVVTDYFSRHITAIALPNCTAETTARTLFNEYFCKYGIPAVILSDQGSHFRNQLMENIQHLVGYNHIYSTPYHPQSNGIVERFNSTFVSQISKLQDAEHNNWDEYLQAVVFAYNTGIHKTTKFSPYELIYGRVARLPIATRPAHFRFTRPNDYFEQLRKTLRTYHQSARQNIATQQQYNKVSYDQNRADPHYRIGDKVLTRIHGLRGKLEPKFAPIPKVIIRIQHPVYLVQDEETQITSRVHVGDLRPINCE